MQGQSIFLSENPMLVSLHAAVRVHNNYVGVLLCISVLGVSVHILPGTDGLVSLYGIEAEPAAKNLLLTENIDKSQS